MTTAQPKHGALRVWHIPQVPMRSFDVDVGSVAEGVLLLKALAAYDAFQFEHNIKPDYCNAQGLLMYDGDEGEWFDWYDEATGEDDPAAFVAAA